MMKPPRSDPAVQSLMSAQQQLDLVAHIDVNYSDERRAYAFPKG
jgi:hypothetical protein